ncbi:uncharacterized protein LOC111704881 [Eurytemora carolleeae]|uniref:uncharacterized protein LOC111704881 n=1 Tax=Eurytemora carolleeae TaxID=1294199 RepID=UPI000C76CF9C|nr:uncharacterized protein LOC111704881 [Eurytemora carolleeae]XP_023333024.1 uncharacterized protein LOC111704881 [Eurytemora carolleeae]|eukprot:XP_023333023.1 uncharacterized protein LOC111704881 [Eurytemora affinis]
MPRRRGVASLYSLGVSATSNLLLQGCQKCDANTDLFSYPPSPTKSPTKIKISPCRYEVDTTLSVELRVVKDWLGNLPDTVVEEVVSSTLFNLEARLLVDKDKKLILTLINIETIKMNDFFFGIHSLLNILRGFCITNLNISKRLWCILWEYEEILNSKLLREVVATALPHLPSLSTLNLAYLADDRMMITIGKYLPCLLSLDISNSLVTDRGIKLLAGSSSVSSPRLQPSPSVVRNLSNLLDTEPILIEYSDRDITSLSTELKPVFLKLESLTMQSCDCITECGIRFILEKYKNMKTLVYHQRRSVFEIIIKWSSEMEHEDIKSKIVKLEMLEHGFPYGVTPFSEQINRLLSICPHLTNLNLVTDDSILPYLSGFSHLSSLTVELEDWIGEGFITFLRTRGEHLREISVSCSTDPDSVLETVEGGQQGHLFNIVVLAVATLCSKVTKLSVSGCGLVSSQIVESLELLTHLNSTQWIRNNSRNWFRNLEVLMLMSYEETLPSMTIHSVLLQYILKAVSSLQILSLEGNFGTFFTDDYLRSVLLENRFPQLRILDISVNDQGGVPGSIPLTISSAQSLLEKCDLLSELRISDWDISDTEFTGLQEQVNTNNWNLSLTRKRRVV